MKNLLNLKSHVPILWNFTPFLFFNEQMTFCFSFPDWMQGHWEYMQVEQETLIYKDRNTFKTYTIKCAGNFESEEKYLVYTRTQW